MAELNTIFTQTANTLGQNLRALMDTTDITNITYHANGLLARNGITAAEKRERFIEYFYDKMLLDTIEIKAKENVFLKYCETRTVPQGHAKYLLRRYAPLTEHLVPLAEGVPPKSDSFATESFEGTFAQYGRYTELTDRVDFAVIDPLLAMRSSQYGEVAVRTAERLARKEAIEFGSEVYANSKDGIAELIIGDNIGIADYRALALKLKRILVEPINGKYRVICSPEHIYDLVEDPLVVEYMKLTHTADPMKTGQPVELFGITFEETMLDEYTYGYYGSGMEYPSEYESSNVKYLRVYAIDESGNEYYHNIAATFKTATDPADVFVRTVSDARLVDGSYIPNKVFWDIEGWDTKFKTTAGGKYIKITRGSDGSVASTTEITLVENTAEPKATELKLSGYGALKLDWKELPVHKSFMFGKEWMAKTGMDGRMNAKFFVKAKGSAGVLDPIDQRQSVGFKIDTLGFNILREEAVHVFHFVPVKAVEVADYLIAKAPAYHNAYGITEPTATAETVTNQRSR